MEVESRELDGGHGGGKPYNVQHIFLGDTELVLGQSRGDVCVGVCIDVGVDAEAHARAYIKRGGKFVDDIQFRRAFHVEHGDAGLQGDADFPVCLSDAREDNLRSGKTGVQGRFNLAAAHAVGTQPGGCNLAQDVGVAVGLDGVVYVVVAVSFCLAADGVEGLGQQPCVINITRCLILVCGHGRCRQRVFSEGLAGCGACRPRRRRRRCCSSSRHS